jgi:hypothetical protein
MRSSCTIHLYECTRVRECDRATPSAQPSSDTANGWKCDFQALGALGDLRVLLVGEPCRLGATRPFRLRQRNADHSSGRLEAPAVERILDGVETVGHRQTSELVVDVGGCGVRVNDRASRWSRSLHAP